MSRDLSDLLERTARGPCEPDFDPASIPVRARRRQRAGAVATAALVLVGLLGGGMWVRTVGTSSGPSVDLAPAGEVPASWQHVTIGEATLSVPPDWEIVHLGEDPMAYCRKFYGSPALYLGADPQPPPRCPALMADPVVGVQAIGFAVLGGRFDGAPVEVNGHDGFVTEAEGIRHYVFSDLAVMLDVNYAPDPALADRVLSTLRPADTPTEADIGQPSAAAAADDIDVGPALATGAIPAMGPEGVALQTPAGVVFVGLDGTVQGHLPTAELAIGGPADGVAGPVPVHLPSDGNREPDPSFWLQPATGATAPLRATPLGGGHQVVERDTGLDPSPLELRPVDTDAVISEFSPNLGWHLSAGHRVVTWHECPDGATDLGACTAQAYDTDMGARLQLEPGCWVSDSFGDFSHLVVCWRSWPEDSTSWIERHDPGQEPVRVDLPRYRDQPADWNVGNYRNAFMVGDQVVATWGSECEVPIPVVAARGDAPRALLAEDFETSPAVRILGITADGRAVVHELGDGCGDDTNRGIQLVDPVSGDVTEVVRSANIEAAKMWTSHPTLDAAR